MLGYKFDDEDEKKRKSLVMPEYISTPPPADKYSCHQDSGQDSSSEEKSTELLSN